MDGRTELLTRDHRVNARLNELLQRSPRPPRHHQVVVGNAVRDATQACKDRVTVIAEALYDVMQPR